MKSRGSSPGLDPGLDATHTVSRSIERPDLGQLRAERSPTQIRDPARYQILGEHGRGGLGRVSRAHDLELGRDVAIKELLSRSSASELRFAREALITARLEHPGIVPVHEAGRWPDGTPFYAMKLVSGRSLRELIAERITVEHRLELLPHVIAVANAIAYAHGRHIIHRDLKPSNVIVGDFGEAVVIDWGLAKDLSAADELDVGKSPAAAARDHDLTSTGSVLGTPAYMAPEQARGEHVDQRADVFAIGAMLWELCTLPQPPSTDASRPRRAGVDRDLIAIIDKARAADPRDRYPDAGVLAADLMAFKAGARIMARRYSLVEVLGHWARRRRALAGAIAIAAVVSTAGVARYVHDIAAERDRADRSARVATDALNAMTLHHAETLLMTDPTTALQTVVAYRGADRDRARQIRAEAMGRGVATLEATPHTGGIGWMQALPNDVVVSGSADGTITRTHADGRSETLVKDLPAFAPLAYASRRHLLAYTCGQDDLCLLDVVTGRSSRAGLRAPAAAMSFSPDEHQLAVASKTGELRVLDLQRPEQPVERLHVPGLDATAVLFVTNDTVAVNSGPRLTLLRLDGSMQALVDPDRTLWEVGTDDDHMVIATSKAQGYLVDLRDARASQPQQLCHDSLSGIKTIPQRRVIAFSCREGTIGIWDPRQGTVTLKAQLEGSASILRVSADGDYLAAAGNNGVLLVVDLQTDLVSHFAGQGFRIGAIATPAEDARFFATGDLRGRVRRWPLPARLIRTLAHTRRNIISAFYDTHTQKLIMTAPRVLLAYSAAGGLEEPRPRTPDAPYIATADDASLFVTYGANGVIELWPTSSLSRQRSWRTQQGELSHAEVLDRDGSLLTSGSDGSLLRWSPSGEHTLVHQFAQPIEAFAVAMETQAVVVATRDGALWLVDSAGKVAMLHERGARATKLTALSDRLSVSVGYANGRALVIDTQTRVLTFAMHASDAIRDIASDGQSIAFATNDNTAYIGARDATRGGPRWVTLLAQAAKLATTRDGVLIVICTDGTIWCYSTQHRDWVYLEAGAAALTQLVFDAAETTAYVIDVDGRILSLDLQAVRQRLKA